MPYCSQCGEMLSPNANFCPSCGVSLAQVPPVSSIDSVRVPKIRDNAAQMSELYVDEPSASASPATETTNQDQTERMETYPLPAFDQTAAVPVRISQRSAAITVSSVLYFSVGMVGLLLSVLLLVASLSLNLGYVNISFFGFLPIIGKYLSGSTTALSLEFLLLVLSAFHFITGNWLWRSLKRGAVLGTTVALSNIGIAVVVLLLFPYLADASYLIMTVSALLILAVVSGWSSLHAEAVDE